jgi:hypothetical protein
MQSHHCAYLHQGDQCRCDEHCQYKLTISDEPFGQTIFCGKDQITRMKAGGA